jgi:hypothetical protein
MRDILQQSLFRLHADQLMIYSSDDEAPQNVPAQRGQSHPEFAGNSGCGTCIRQAGRRRRRRSVLFHTFGVAPRRGVTRPAAPPEPWGWFCPDFWEHLPYPLLPPSCAHASFARALQPPPSILGISLKPASAATLTSLSLCRAMHARPRIIERKVRDFARFGLTPPNVLIARPLRHVSLGDFPVVVA